QVRGHRARRRRFRAGPGPEPFGPDREPDRRARQPHQAGRRARHRLLQGAHGGVTYSPPLVMGDAKLSLAMICDAWRMRRLAAALVLVSLPAFAADAPKKVEEPGTHVEMPFLIAPMSQDGKLLGYAYISSNLFSSS